MCIRDSFGANLVGGSIYNSYFGSTTTSTFGLWTPTPASGFIPVQVGGDFGWIEVTVNSVFPNQGTASSLTVNSWALNTSGAPALVDPAVCDVEIVPTMGEWGLICLNLFLMIFGVTAIRQNGKIKVQSKTT